MLKKVKKKYGKNEPVQLLMNKYEVKCIFQYLVLDNIKKNSNNNDNNNKNIKKNTHTQKLNTRD